MEPRSNDSVADRLPFNKGLFCTSPNDSGFLLTFCIEGKKKTKIAGPRFSVIQSVF